MLSGNSFASMFIHKQSTSELDDVLLIHHLMSKSRPLNAHIDLSTDPYLLNSKSPLPISNFCATMNVIERWTSISSFHVKKDFPHNSFSIQG